MAITAIDYAIFRELASAKVVPGCPDILEFGEANWFGDVGIDQLVGDIKALASEQVKADLLRWLERLFSQPVTERTLFDVAKVFYRTFTNYGSITSIDFHGTEAALRYDLNLPLPLDRQYHVLINSGTAEHIFNVCQFFKTVHERALPGALMIHAFPFTGWLDHGFYNINPTLVTDLAASNNYEVLMWIYGETKPLRVVQIKEIAQVHEMARKGELGPNSMQYAVMRKPREERPFTVPIQGYYAGTLQEQLRKDWMELR